MNSLCTGIDSSSHTAVSSAQVIYSFMTFFFKKKKPVCYFISWLLICFFFFKSIAWNLLSRIPYSVSVSVSGFHVLVLQISGAWVMRSGGEGVGILRDARFVFGHVRWNFFFSSLGIYFFGAESVGIYFFIKNIVGKFFFCFCPTLPHHFSKGPRLIKIY